MKGDKRGVALMLAIKPAPNVEYDDEDMEDMNHDECYEMLMDSIAQYMTQIEEHPMEHNLEILGMVEELLTALKVHIEDDSPAVDLEIEVTE